MRPYSLDLRQRIVDAYRNGKGSVRKLAERFDVAVSTVQSYRNLLRATGHVQPRPHGGGVDPSINEAGLQTVRALLEEKNDRTLAELITLYQQRHAVRVSRSTMHRAVEKLMLTRKKKLFAPASKTGRTSSRRELTLPNRFSISLRTGASLSTNSAPIWE